MAAFFNHNMKLYLRKHEYMSIACLGNIHSKIEKDPAHRLLTAHYRLYGGHIDFFGKLRYGFLLSKYSGINSSYHYARVRTRNI